MANYKEMYITLLHETEKAINTLIEAQKACEELYITSADDNNENYETQDK